MARVWAGGSVAFYGSVVPPGCSLIFKHIIRETVQTGGVVDGYTIGIKRCTRQSTQCTYYIGYPDILAYGCLVVPGRNRINSVGGSSSQHCYLDCDTFDSWTPPITLEYIQDIPGYLEEGGSYGWESCNYYRVGVWSDTGVLARGKLAGIYSGS